MFPSTKHLLGILTAAVLLAPSVGFSASQPDLTMGFVGIDYDAGSQSLTASGKAVLYVDPSGVEYSFPDLMAAPGSFTLSALVDNSGFLVGGSFTVGGTIASLSATDPLLTGALLPGSLTYTNQNPSIFTFTYDPGTLGGDLAADFDDGAGMIQISGLDTVPAFAGGVSFESDFFDDSNNAVADIFVPEPALLSLVLGFTAVSVIALRRRASSV